LYFARKELQSKELEQISELRRKREKETEMLSAQSGIPLGAELDDWTRELQQSPEWLSNYVTLGLVNLQINLLKKQQELIEATIVLEDEKLKYDTCVANAKETYYKILTNKLLTEEAISSEIKSYELSKIDVRALLARYKERMLLIPDLLNNKKRVLENIKKVQQQLKSRKSLRLLVIRMNLMRSWIGLKQRR